MGIVYFCCGDLDSHDVHHIQAEVAEQVCALNDTQFNSLADELQDQISLVRMSPYM